MSWGINCSGTPHAVIDFVQAQKAYPENGDQSQINLAKDLICAIANTWPHDAVISVEAGGHSSYEPPAAEGEAGKATRANMLVKVTQVNNFVTAAD